MGRSIYTIEAGGNVYEIEADSREQALAAIPSSPAPAKPAPAPKGAGSQASPFDLSGGQSREMIPRGTYYRDPQGNIRRNNSGDAGNPIIPPPRKPAPATAPKPKKSPGVMSEINGALANFYRGTGVLDELNAVPMAIGDAIQGGIKPRFAPGDSALGLVPTLRGAADVYRGALARQRGTEDAFAARRPIASELLKTAGAASSVMIPGGAAEQAITAPSRLMGAARGATAAAAQGYAYGMADRGTIPERAQRATESAALSAVLGAGFGAATARGVPKKVKTPSDVQVLRSYGVEPTVGQAAGGLVKNAEDLAMRAPILGPAISGARERVNVQLNRAPALAALKPIGGNLPRNLQPGFETVEYVDKALGKVYDDAAAMVPRVVPDQQLAADISAIAARKADLPESLAGQFDSIIANRLARLQRGEVSGAVVKDIQSELRALAREQAAKGEESLAAMLNDSAGAVMGLIERTNPEAGALIRSADEGWRIYSMMNDAAAAANAKGGVFVPGQFNTQVRKAGRGMGSNMTGKGRAPMQDLATAASRVLPDQFGNPGTANAIGLNGLVVGAVAAPAQTAMAAGGLAAAATPYFAAARRVVETLPPNAGRAELLAAEQELARLAANDPGISVLLQSVQARLGRASGAVGSNATRPPPRVQSTSPQ